MHLNEADPKGLVRESYRIEGISIFECRSIFLDWSLSLPQGRSVADALRVVIAEYALANPGHPMNTVLEAGLILPEVKGRRGGRAGRFGAKEV